jgi:hypothetical protein
MRTKLITSLSGIAIALLATYSATAGTLDASTAQPHVATLSIDTPVIAVKHIFAVGYYNNETASCGIRMEYSDGTPAKNMTLTKATTSMQFIESRSYDKAGVYKVTVSGYAWGAYKACLGTQVSSTEIKAALPSKATSMTTPYPKMMTAPGGTDMLITINGAGGNCVLNVMTNSEPGPKAVEVDVKTFPVTVKLKFPDLNYEYKYKIHAMPGTPKLFFGPACDGNNVSLDVATYPKPPVAPYIKGMYVRGLTSGADDAARTDEPIEFAVEGNINNGNDPAQQCGWTLLLIDSNGQGKPALTGNKFSASQTIPAGKLASFAPGMYTMRVKSTALDDGLANQSCGSQADKKFTLKKATATIKDVTLVAFAYHFNMASSDGYGSPDSNSPNLSAYCQNCNSVFSPAHDIGVLRIKPIFSGGETCSYAVIQKFNGKQTTHSVFYTIGDAMTGIPAISAPRLNVYPNNETIVTVTLQGTAGPGGPCDGSATKTIAVHDNVALRTVTK